MKKIIKSLICLLLIFVITACKQDNFEGINIYTTVYPMEYITKVLYGNHSNINSIYPSGVDISSYELNEKQVKDYSETDLYLFNGLSNEKNYVAKFFKHNKDLKIIDATSSMEVFYDVNELWLNPSNFLMMAQNIRYGLKEYINNHYLKNEIDENYSKLKEQVSLLDANIYDIVSNAKNKIIITSSNTFKFLEKYGLQVIILEENEDLTEREINNAINLIKNGTVHYIFLKNGEETSATVKRVIDATNVPIAYFNTLSNLSGEDRNAKKDYMSVMNDNIDLLRNELYD